MRFFHLTGETVSALQSDWATLLRVYYLILCLLFDFMFIIWFLHLIYNRNDTHTVQQSAEFPRQKLFFCLQLQSHSAATLNNNSQFHVSGCVCFPWCLIYLVDIWTLTNDYSLDDQQFVNMKHWSSWMSRIAAPLMFDTAAVCCTDTRSVLRSVWFLSQRQVCSFQSETQRQSNRATVVCVTYIDV